jgi:hypothetical protein
MFSLSSTVTDTLMAVVSQIECGALIAHGWESVLLYFSGGDAEYPFDEALLSNDIAFGQLADLTFANDVYGLVSRDAAQGAVCRPEPLARHHPLRHKT